MQKVLIASICYDGTITSWFADSLLRTIKHSMSHDVDVHAVYISYDSLVQRAKNSAFRIAIEGDYDFLFLIGRDVEWKAETFIYLLNRQEDMVGVPVVEKNATEKYISSIDSDTNKSSDGELFEVEKLSSSFIRISKFAINKLWTISDLYISEEKQERMVFDVRIKDDTLICDDTVLSEKWKSLGYKLWLYPEVTINSIGELRYTGDIASFLQRLQYN